MRSKNDNHIETGKRLVRLLLFLAVLILVLAAADFWLVDTDSVTAMTIREMQNLSDIQLAVVGSSVVRDHFNQQIISKRTGLSSFSVTIPGAGFQTFIAATEEMYKTSSPEWVVLVVEPYNFNTAREDPQPYYKLFPWLTGFRTRLRYYKQTAEQDGYWLDRALIFRDFPARSWNAIVKTFGMRLNPEQAFGLSADALSEEHAQYMGRGFLRHDGETGMDTIIRQEMLAERDLGYQYPLLPESKSMLMEMRELAESHGSRFLVLISDNHTSHALAEPEYLRYMQHTMDFCAQCGIECYNLFYAKEDFLPNLDSYFYDLYHMNGEGADIVSEAFAQLIQALSSGEDVSGWFYQKDWQYRETINWIVNTWVHPEGEGRFTAGCNTGSLVHPLYRFVLLDHSGQETLLQDWSTKKKVEVALQDGKTLRVYAKLAEYPEQTPAYFDYPDDYDYALTHQHLY